MVGVNPAQLDVFELSVTPTPYDVMTPHDADTAELGTLVSFCQLIAQKPADRGAP